MGNEQLLLMPSWAIKCPLDTFMGYVCIHFPEPSWLLASYYTASVILHLLRCWRCLCFSADAANLQASLACRNMTPRVKWRGRHEEETDDEEASLVSCVKLGRLDG